MLEFCPKMEELFVTHDDISLLTHCCKPSASSNPQDLLNLVTSTSHDSEFLHLYNNNINKQKWNNSITDIIMVVYAAVPFLFISFHECQSLLQMDFWRFCNTLHILIWFCDILSENQSLNGIVGSFKMHQCHWIICMSTVCYVIKSSCACVSLVEEWRSKWFLERRWQKCGSDELIKAMSDINDHVRLAAVSACSKAAELRQIDKQQNKLGNLSMHYFYNLYLVFFIKVKCQKMMFKNSTIIFHCL